MKAGKFKAAGSKTPSSEPSGPPGAGAQQSAAALKNAVLKALRSCALHRAFLGLPALLEETRRLYLAEEADDDGDKFT